MESMKQVAPVFWVALLAGGVSGAVISAVVMPSQSEGYESLETGDGVDEQAWAARFEALERENEELRSRLRGLELDVPAAAPAESAEPQRQPEGGYVGRTEFEAFMREVRLALEGLGASPLASQEGFQEQVAQALDELREDERKGKGGRKLEDEISAYRDWLGFNEVQEEQWRVALEQRADRNQELRDAWQSGSVDEAGIAQMKQQNAAAFEAEVTRILTPSQLTTYRSKSGGGGSGGGK